MAYKINKKGKKVKLHLATSNRGKAREIKELYDDMEIIPYTDIIDEFEIEESGATFKENAIIKATAVYKELGDDSAVVIADDSGISVPLLGGEPGIYSARYAGVDASDKENINKLIDELKKNGAKQAEAFYTAAIAIVTNGVTLTAHGWMHGIVTTKPRGSNGFGYDPIFIPDRHTQTLGELSDAIKKSFSHRSIALKRARMLLSSL